MPATTPTIKAVCACGAKMRVPAAAAGRRAKCPKCRGTVQIPTADAMSSNVAGAADRAGGASTNGDRIRTECSACGKSLRVPKHAAGKRVKCPKCGNAIKIPDLDAAPVGVASGGEDLLGGDENALGGDGGSLGAGEAALGGDDDLLGGDDGLLDSLATGEVVDTPAAPSGAAALTCPACGVPVPADAKKCRMCGHDPRKPVRAASSGGAPRPSSSASMNADAIGEFVTSLFASRLWRVWALIIGGGVALIITGVNEMRLSGATSMEPQTISCAELAANGPGDNAHVILTDFLLCEFGYVYAIRGSMWDGAWVPAVPLGGEYHRVVQAKLGSLGPDDFIDPNEIPLPSDIKVVVSMPKALGEDDIAALAEQDEIQGTIINLIASLDAETRKILESNYTDSDFDNCWILEAGRVPGGAKQARVFISGGGFLVVIGGILLVVFRGSS